MSWTIK